MDKRLGQIERERAHFDRLVEREGDAGTFRKKQADRKRLERRADLLANRLLDIEHPNVLELGVGAGAFTEALLNRMERVRLTGCDVSPKSLELANSRLRDRADDIDLQIGNCEALDFEDGQFDCVCGCSILHHVAMPDVLVEIGRVLKPKGLLWFSEPNLANPQIALHLNVRWLAERADYTEDETAFLRWRLENQLHDSGFDSVQVTPFDFLHPYTPAPLIPIVEQLGVLLEKIPGVREISGSLEIVARKH